MDYGNAGDYDDFASHPSGGGGEWSGHQEGSPNSSPRAPTVQTLTPVTIFQLLTAQQNVTEDSFRVDRKELQNLTFVGQVIKIDETETVVTYLVDDGTGSIPVKFWLEQRSANPHWREGLYLRVFGTIRSFAEERNVVAFKIVEVLDLNELVHHQLEVLTLHVQVLQERAGGVASTVATHGLASSSSSSSSSSAAQPSTSQDISTFVYNAVKSRTTSEAGNIGISRADLASMCQGYLDNSQLVALLEQLISGGHLYNSIDDFHYKAAEHQ